jgi:hypothetical protein
MRRVASLASGQVDLKLAVVLIEGRKRAVSK